MIIIDESSSNSNLEDLKLQAAYQWRSWLDLKGTSRRYQLRSPSRQGSTPLCNSATRVCLCNKLARHQRDRRYRNLLCLHVQHTWIRGEVGSKFKGKNGRGAKEGFLTCPLPTTRAQALLFDMSSCGQVKKASWKPHLSLPPLNPNKPPDPKMNNLELQFIFWETKKGWGARNIHQLIMHT